jgi:hypothetical protein
VPVDHAETVWQVAFLGAKARGRDLLAGFVAAHGNTVRAGPFAGMRLPTDTSWGDGDTLAKLIGCYEAALHPAIAEIVAAAPDLAINVGCAEGYYAVGLARLLPDARTHAFDISDKAQAVCREAGRANGVDARLSVAGACSAAVLRLLLGRARNPVVVCDAEGAEAELIDPARVPELARTTLLIECHDFAVPGVTDALVARLSGTHAVYLVRETAPDPQAFADLGAMSSFDRAIAACEYRPCLMHWLYCKPNRG